MRKRIRALFIRRKESYNYMKNPSAAPSWGNNDHNNMLDTCIIFIEGVEKFECAVQTVSNHPEARFRDTIAPGEFGLRLFVDPRLFSGRIHGIVGARDLEGDFVDFESVQLDDLARWLQHDTRKLKSRPSDPDLSTVTRVAWSAGCFVHHPPDLERINSIYLDAGANPGIVIPAELVVV